MRKTPFRPSNEISQALNSGLVTIYSVSDGAEPGRLPQPVLAFKGVLRYEERSLGIQRAYLGKQNRVEIQRVIRVPRGIEISSQDLAITDDRRQYRVDLVQHVQGVLPACSDLTLVKTTKKLEIEGRAEE